MIMISSMLKKCFLLAGLLLGCALYPLEQQMPHPATPSTPTAAAAPATADAVSIQQDVEYGMQGGEKLLLISIHPRIILSSPGPRSC